MNILRIHDTAYKLYKNIFILSAKRHASRGKPNRVNAGSRFIQRLVPIRRAASLSRVSVLFGETFPNWRTKRANWGKKTSGRHLRGGRVWVWRILRNILLELQFLEPKNFESIKLTSTNCAAIEYYGIGVTCQCKMSPFFCKSSESRGLNGQILPDAGRSHVTKIRLLVCF